MRIYQYIYVWPCSISIFGVWSDLFNHKGNALQIRLIQRAVSLLLLLTKLKIIKLSYMYIFRYARTHTERALFCLRNTYTHSLTHRFARLFCLLYLFISISNASFLHLNIYVRICIYLFFFASQLLAFQMAPFRWPLIHKNKRHAEKRRVSPAKQQ